MKEFETQYNLAKEEVEKQFPSILGLPEEDFSFPDELVSFIETEFYKIMGYKSGGGVPIREEMDQNALLQRVYNAQYQQPDSIQLPVTIAGSFGDVDVSSTVAGKKTTSKTDLMSIVNLTINTAAKEIAKGYHEGHLRSVSVPLSDILEKCDLRFDVGELSNLVICPRSFYKPELGFSEEQPQKVGEGEYSKTFQVNFRTKRRSHDGSADSVTFYEIHPKNAPYYTFFSFGPSKGVKVHKLATCLRDYNELVKSGELVYENHGKLVHALFYKFALAIEQKIQAYQAKQGGEAGR